MRTDGVVVMSPSLNGLLRSTEHGYPVHVWALIANRAVEALNQGGFDGMA